MKLILASTLLIYVLSAPLLFSSERASAQLGRQTIMFVHGAWGGGWDYKNLQALLEAKGHNVYRVTLTGQGERSHLMSADINLDTHIMDVVNTIEYEELNEIILVGHSYGGMVITGVVDKVPEKISHLVYVDAILPIDGETAMSLFTAEQTIQLKALALAHDGGISIPPFWPGWKATKDVAHPLATLLQPISLTNQDVSKVPATYVLTLEAGAKTDPFSRYAERAKQRGWHYVEWVTGHNAQRTMPTEYIDLLDNLVD